jgi:hypothetical protein
VTDILKIARLPHVAAFGLFLALGACTQGGFVEEGTEAPPGDDNVAKNLLIGMGAIDDPNAKAVKYQPRAPLVVPPKRNLPSPVDPDATAANSNFPVDQEEQDAKRRRATPDGKFEDGHVMTPAERARYANLPVGDAPARTFNEKDSSKPLTPDQMSGKEMKDAVAQIEQRQKANPQTSLLTPPADYRTPSSKAPIDPPKEESSWKPGWWPF